jgi:DNA polymerase (family 10)
MVAVDPDLRGSDEVRNQGDDLVIHVTRPECFGIALLRATSSTDHLAALEKMARRKGMVLNADGVVRNGRRIAHETEPEIYAALGLPYIAPELRETGKEVQLAADGELPELVTLDDLRGVLHVHTTESDGSDTLEEMAEAPRQRGFAYLGLTDHSQTAHYAGGRSMK